MMQQERIVFGAGPLPDLAEQLYVLFVEPGEPGRDTFYAEDPAQGLADVREAYPGDSLITLHPLVAVPPTAAVADRTADHIVADLSELVSAPYYAGIVQDELLPDLCRASLAFLRARPWDGHRLMVADLVAAPFSVAEVAVAEPVGDSSGFTVFPGRGAFARMAQAGRGGFSPEGSLVLDIATLPAWAAPAAVMVYGAPIMPLPILIAGEVRTMVDDAGTTVLAAIAAAFGGHGEAQVGGVTARLRPWRA